MAKHIYLQQTVFHIVHGERIKICFSYIYNI